MTAAKRFQKVLIANRGEIALRVARTLLEMDITPVAIYSDADRTAPHVRACPYAYRVGAAAAAESYLCHDIILQVARSAGVDAIHPGYGFLSENADFADSVAAAGIAFIGPPAQAIRIMGAKTGARKAMQKAGVPTVPGSDGPLEHGAAGEEQARLLAQRMGYPVMLKASAGGGGKGMRLIHSDAELPAGLRAAASEARNAFGDDTIYMEKAILSPRHVEIQVFGDSSGQIFAIGERECSMQRRHQKVLEESPSPLIDEPMRRSMSEVACRAAAAVNYRGAGTVEFLVDRAKNFYFLEMNTRLQVEHPVTEMCYGIDLVHAQLQAAQDRSLEQQHFVSRGHAMEVRLYAEDPRRNFLPCPGQITELRLPHGPGVRVDCGVDSSSCVTQFYDPLMAKIIVWAEDRDRARRRMLRALRETHIQGIDTNLDFLKQLVASDSFSSGHYHTGTVAEVLANPDPASRLEVQELAALAAVIQTYKLDLRATRPVHSQERGALQSGVAQGGWRLPAWRARGG